MGKSYYANNPKRDGQDKNKLSLAEKAQPYVGPIAAILNLEKADAPTIKAGISTIDKMLQKNKNVTSHQVRNIFDLINDIDPDKTGNEQSLKALNMLRPKLAYIGARQTNEDGKIVVQVLDELIKQITDENNATIIQNKIKGLRYVMESIVAYQKYYSKN
jgi:CRISPR type III-A-associated protein Csm2